MVAKKIRKIISLYRDSLGKKISIDKLIFDFKKFSDKERFSILWDAREESLTRKIDMDILGLTPAEFTKASPLTTLGEIKETGVEVKV